jgi:hypothetical protein
MTKTQNISKSKRAGMMLALSVLVLGGSACAHGLEQLEAGRVHQSVPACVLVAPHADEDPDGEILASTGAVDYQDGAWHDADGNVVGYAPAEDSAVWTC